ncbi:small ribosomal subunit protein mS75 isoform X2 [Malania oleifera]|uniref:small ribosomal subunit protein mS75 isoform X2 n=1 Tax=Malania oleifera TaxID=397392 RepID=UPI0025AE8133|nr:small ribosomal subunit protein mS75 isoform X2 [Malania oleifera]
MRIVHQIISQLSAASPCARAAKFLPKPTSGNAPRIASFNQSVSRAFSAAPSGGGSGKDDDWGKSIGGNAADDLGWDVASSWSTGLTKEHFDGEAVGHQVGSSGSGGGGGGVGIDAVAQRSTAVGGGEEVDNDLKELDEENKKGRAFVEGWGERMREMSVLLKQVREPGVRGSYLKDSEKSEMYRLHKANPEVYTVEKLAKDYRIMRQRVHAILWLKELEEEEEKKFGPLDDSVELLLDTCPEWQERSSATNIAGGVLRMDGVLQLRKWGLVGSVEVAVVGNL